MTATDIDPRISADTAALARLLEGRWSCRGFQPDPVPRDTITRVLDLARQSPSWCNTQPWQVIITEGEGTERFRAALSAHAASSEMEPDFPFPARYSGPYQERRRECGFQLYDSVGIAKGDRAASAKQAAKNFEFFGAPHAAIITTEAELGVYGAIDCGLYVQTFLLAAQSLGLGAIPQAALATHAPFIRDHFGLPENQLIVCGVSFGWPDHDHPANGFRTSRVPVDDTVIWAD
jgi:nitroreductase